MIIFQSPDKFCADAVLDEKMTGFQGFRECLVSFFQKYCLSLKAIVEPAILIPGCYCYVKIFKSIPSKIQKNAIFVLSIQRKPLTPDIQPTKNKV